MNTFRCYHTSPRNCKSRIIYKVIHIDCMEETPCSPTKCIVYTCKKHYQPKVDRILIDYGKGLYCSSLKRNKEVIKQELRTW